MGTTAHSDDLRSRVVAEILAGASRRQAAERFRVSAASAVRWAQLHSQTGGVGPRPRGGKSRSPLEPHAAWVLDLTTAEPDLTLEAIVQRLLAGLGLKTSEAAVHDATARFPSASTSVTTSVGPLFLRTSTARSRRDRTTMQPSRRMSPVLSRLDR